jgi:translation initiation factor 2B subunit (eIF-2B alpha/beta/delta family)
LVLPVDAALLAARVQELRDDRSHGASWMARRAVETLTELAEIEASSGEELLERLLNAGRRLATSRPGVGAVAGAVGRTLAAAGHESHLELDELRRVIQEEARALDESRQRAAASITIQLRERLDGATVITHSASGTVREAFQQTQPAKVICTASEPVGEGREFAEEWREAGFDVELVEDEEAPGRVAETSILLIGADTVFRDGTICNKVGTIPLAKAAAEAGVPTIVAAEVIKLAPVPGSQAPELADIERSLFELVPPDLITEVVTEEGMFTPDEIATLVDRVPFLSEGYALVLPVSAGRQ